MSNHKMSSHVLLSLATAPVLLGLLGIRAIAELVSGFGQASEEIFRGDRLPVLNFPTTDSDESPTD